MSPDAEATLPPGLELLWGRREAGRRGPKPSLDVEAIVAAAIDIADAEGLEAVSMARVAQELGFTTMSLYRHVRSKDELLQLMWHACAANMPTITGDGWRSKLESWALAQRDVVLRRSWILQMPVVNPPAGPNSLAWVEQALEALEGSGLTDGDKFGVVGLLSSYTLSDARMAYEARSAAGGERQIDYAMLLRQVADEQTYPALHRAAHSGEIDGSGPEAEEEGFRFALDLILDGVASLIEKRSGTQRHDST